MSALELLVINSPDSNENTCNRWPQQCLVPVNMLPSEALHERWPFGHLSSYMFRN